MITVVDVLIEIASALLRWWALNTSMNR